MDSIKGTLRRRLSPMFLYSFESTYFCYIFTMKMILINADVIYTMSPKKLSPLNCL